MHYYKCAKGHTQATEDRVRGCTECLLHTFYYYISLKDEKEKEKALKLKFPVNEISEKEYIALQL